MQDDTELHVLMDAAAPAPALHSGAIVIPFPTRESRRATSTPVNGIGPLQIVSLLNLVGDTLAPNSAMHAPTCLAALGGVAGFAAQQSLLIGGGPAWMQPARNGHLDRLLLSETASDASLWHHVRLAARAVGAEHLPDPKKLLEATLRCVGTTQLGRITLPLEYRLNEQPHETLTALWPTLREHFRLSGIGPRQWPALVAQAIARRVGSDHRAVPPHVALRIVMQAALAMALIEPRLVPGSATKPGIV